MDLYKRSTEIILENQSPTGGYPASPNFRVYRYCWLRDGSFIAHAMDRVGRPDSARAFHRWVGRVIRGHAWKVARAVEKASGGLPLGDEDVLHTRFTQEGREARDGWWNFQLDGYGTWLWALSAHVEEFGETGILDEISDSVELTVRYLSALWALPNYDCWEEHPNDLNPYTLAAIFGGLMAAEFLAERMGNERLKPTLGLAMRIRAQTLVQGVREGHLIKAFPPGEGPHPGDVSAEVDSNLVGVSTPYRMLAPGDPIMARTAERIVEDLRPPGGGVHRYLRDTYYGGGEWLLLTAWLGWHLAETGDRERAAELLAWVEAQADREGNLPEQVSGHLLAPEFKARWETRWGGVAKPLLWSHAMYLILVTALETSDGRDPE